mgnify:CR=1 FL=1
MEEKTDLLSQILYADGDIAQHDARSDAMERLMSPEIKVVTVETADDAISLLREDTNNRIIAVVLSQGLGKDEVRKALKYLEHIGTKNIARFLIVTQSQEKYQDFITDLLRSNQHPGTVIPGIRAPFDIAKTIRDRLISKSLILNISISAAEDFGPSITRDMFRPDFTNSLPEDSLTPSSPTATEEETTQEIDNPEN